MKKEMRELAVRDGKVANFKCGPCEVLRLAYEAHCHCVHLNEKDNLVLAGLRIVPVWSYKRRRTHMNAFLNL